MSDFFYLVSLILLVAGWIFLKEVGRRLGERELARGQPDRDRFAQELLSAILAGSTEKPFVLYLRSFSSKGFDLVTKIDRSKRSPSFSWTIDGIQSEDIEVVLGKQFSPLIGFGRSGEHTGIGRAQVPDDEWKAVFQFLAAKARKIVVVPSTHRGTKWEMERLLESGDLRNKTIFIVPPSTPVGGKRGEVIEWDLEVRTDAFRSLEEFRIDVPPDDGRGMVFRVDSDKIGWGHKHITYQTDSYPKMPPSYYIEMTGSDVFETHEIRYHYSFLPKRRKR